MAVMWRFTQWLDMSSYASQTTGMGFSTFGALVQGQQTANQLNYDATVQTNNANLALSSAAANAAKQSMAATRMMGTMSTGFAANGVSQTSGGVQAAMASSAANAELDRQDILFGGQVKAVNYQNQASLDRVGASNAVKASYFNALSDVIGGGAGVLSNNIGGGGTAAGPSGNGDGSAVSMMTSDNDEGGGGGNAWFYGSSPRPYSQPSLYSEAAEAIG